MKTVYVNFRNDKPHSKYMTGKYIQEMSLPFLLIDDSQGMCICKALDDYDIPWMGNVNDAHVEHIPKDANFIFSPDIISDQPMFASADGDED